MANRQTQQLKGFTSKTYRTETWSAIVDLSNSVYAVSAIHHRHGKRFGSWIWIAEALKEDFNAWRRRTGEGIEFLFDGVRERGTWSSMGKLHKHMCRGYCGKHGASAL